MEIRENAAGDQGQDYVKAPSRKYTWAEVRQAVHDLRKELSSLSTMVPMSISFRKRNNGRTRIYFLRTPQNGWEITLLYSDVVSSVEPNEERLEWKPLIESSFVLGAASSKYSREEQLLWERQRVAAWGISSYELHAQSGRVLFPCASSLFVAAGEDEPAWEPPPILPRVLSTGGAPLTPAMCPRLPRLVAHAARGDVWVAGGSGIARPTRLTYACKGADKLAEDPRQAGVPCYVTQEEFSRYTGFWWQPRSDDDVFRIAYEEVDESDVKIFSFPSSQSSTGEVEEFRFPRAGTPNAKSILRLVQFKLRQISPVTVLDYYQESGTDHHCSYSDREWWECTDIRWFDLRRSLQDVFSWCEYIARVGWTPCGNFVWVQMLDRKQQRLELVLIHVEEFSEPFRYENAPPGDHERSADDTEEIDVPVYTKQVLISETAPTAWINVHDILHFFPASPTGSEGDSQTMSFLWASEETGHLHLYLVTCRLNTAKVKRRKLLDMLSEGGAGVVGPQIVSKVALTSGEWEVIGRKIWVDEARRLVYFVGLRETPLERHLYVTSCDTPSTPVLLTTPGHSCAIDMDEECTIAVITCSNVSTPPSSRVYRVSHENGAVTLVPQGVLMPRQSSADTSSSESTEHRSWNGSREGSARSDGDDDGPVESPVREISTADVGPPQIFRARLSGGADAYCTLWRPARAQPGVRYPTVLHVYGGPEVQCVTNSYKGIRQLRMHMVAARGFCVVAVDSRGSKHRGRAWEAAIRAKMGQVELDDQVEVLQWLARETGCIDMDRVAVHGWSYGGYLSLLGLATRPNVFKVCIAGAPVTCWRLYDTAYTERYMGLPAQAPHAYTRASVLTHAPFFPDQEGRLLIIHGLADENVHFCHTAALLAELVRLGKPHRLQLYPTERHSLRALHAAKHYEATLVHFLHENL